MFVVLLVMAPSYLEVGASGKPGAVQILYSMLGGYVFASDDAPEMVDFVFNEKDDAIEAAREFQSDRRANPDDIVDLSHLRGRELRNALRALDWSPSRSGH
ncbi:MAG: hypothetical protein WBA44_01290 [Mesorhizobium sp.]